jgi:hypothetical protein
MLHKLYNIRGLLMKHNLEHMQRVECINDTILFPPQTFISLLGVWEIHDTLDKRKVILDVYSRCLKMSTCFETLCSTCLLRPFLSHVNFVTETQCHALKLKYNYTPLKTTFKPLTVQQFCTCSTLHHRLDTTVLFTCHYFF